MSETVPGSADDLIKVAAGKVIFKEGDAGDTVYVVLDGKVDLRVQGRLLETVGPGGVLGEMALIEHAPRVATATAKTAADLLPISEARFMSMIQKTPHFALQIMKVIAARLRTMNSRLLAAKQEGRPARRPAPAKRRSTSRPKAAKRRSSRR